MGQSIQQLQVRGKAPGVIETAREQMAELIGASGR
jgi:hypothetical protein